jgi:hypothetical protein
MPDQFSVLFFVFSLTRFQTLLACCQAAILIDFLESLSTLLIASLLVSFALFLHNSPV